MEVIGLKTLYHLKQDQETSLSETNATKTNLSLLGIKLPTKLF